MVFLKYFMKAGIVVILLIDNGSKRASATLQLRGLAEKLTEQVGQKVFPVSLQHADQIHHDELGGVPANTLSGFLKSQLESGEREFKLLPLFFGLSRALTSFVPEVVAELQAEYGDFEYSLCDVLYPLPEGDSGLIQVLYEHAVQTAEVNELPLENLVLVDHGSPVSRVTDVRKHMAERLQAMLGESVSLDQAVMERREGREYDFNGPLLADWLTEKAEAGAESAIVLMQFLLPGRHAGRGGDVAEICGSVIESHPDFQVAISPLIGEHPLIIDRLASRLDS